MLLKVGVHLKEAVGYMVVFEVVELKAAVAEIVEDLLDISPEDQVMGGHKSQPVEHLSPER